MQDARPGRLAGKTALITGAASGIGRATAMLFHAEGEGRRDRPQRSGARRARRRRPHAPAGRDRRSALARRRRRGLPLSAGSTSSSTAPASDPQGNIETETLADWRKTQAVNVEGTFLGCREAVRAMKVTGGGSIVNLSSVAGIIGDAQTIAYCASKGAVRLLTKSAALHCGRSGYKIRREFSPSLVRRHRRWCRSLSRARRIPSGRARASCAPRRSGASAGRGGRRRDPLSGERRVGVHHRRRDHRRRRPDGAVKR